MNIMLKRFSPIQRRLYYDKIDTNNMIIRQIRKMQWVIFEGSLRGFTVLQHANFRRVDR
jgi:hypothetical protein